MEINGYLRALCWAYLDSPPESREEDLLDEAIDAACARLGLNAGDLVGAVSMERAQGLNGCVRCEAHDLLDAGAQVRPGEGWSIGDLGGGCAAWHRSAPAKDHYFQIQEPDVDAPGLPTDASDVLVLLFNAEDEDAISEHRGTLESALAWVAEHEHLMRGNAAGEEA